MAAYCEQLIMKIIHTNTTKKSLRDFEHFTQISGEFYSISVIYVCLPTTNAIFGNKFSFFYTIFYRRLNLKKTSVSVVWKMVKNVEWNFVGSQKNKFIIIFYTLCLSSFFPSRHGSPPPPSVRSMLLIFSIAIFLVIYFAVVVVVIFWRYTRIHITFFFLGCPSIMSVFNLMRTVNDSCQRKIPLFLLYKNICLVLK